MNWNMVAWVVARAREKSTYAGLVVLLGMIGLPDAQSWSNNLAMACMGLAGLAAMFMKEAGAPDA